MTSSGDLVADLDADGTADRVTPSALTGGDVTITFGAEDGQRTKVGPDDLVGDGGEDAQDTLAVVADFDQDGWNDLFIVATGAFRGDDPVEPDVSELRFGPFSARGRGQSARPVALTAPRAVTVADYDHDRYPDLAVYGHEGDGVYSTTARLGSRKGLGRELASVRGRPVCFRGCPPAGRPRRNTAAVGGIGGHAAGNAASRRFPIREAQASVAPESLQKSNRCFTRGMAHIRYPHELIETQQHLVRAYRQLADPAGQGGRTVLRRQVIRLANQLLAHPYWSSRAGAGAGLGELRAQARAEQAGGGRP